MEGAVYDKELYNIYLDNETPPRIVKVALEELDSELDLESGPADPYLKL